MKTTLTFISLSVTLAAGAQLTNSSFENWSNLTSHTYENEMLSVHQVPGATHGDIDGWSYDMYAGISRTTDATDGNYSVILHNWYNYVQTSLMYRGTVSAYPESISGMYKFVAATINDSAFVQVTVKSSMNEVIIDDMFYFGHDSTWTAFNFALTLEQWPINPADSIFILFHNATTTCDGNLMTCNLLYLDNVDIQEGAAKLTENEGLNIRIYPNPADELLRVELGDLAGKTNLQWEIVDISGRSQLRGSIDRLSNELNVSGLNPGTYVLSISDQQSIITREQVLIR